MHNPEHPTGEYHPAPIDGIAKRLVRVREKLSEVSLRSIMLDLGKSGFHIFLASMGIEPPKDTTTVTAQPTSADVARVHGYAERALIDGSLGEHPRVREAEEIVRNFDDRLEEFRKNADD